MPQQGAHSASVQTVRPITAQCRNRRYGYENVNQGADHAAKGTNNANQPAGTNYANKVTNNDNTGTNNANKGTISSNSDAGRSKASPVRTSGHAALERHRIG